MSKLRQTEFLAFLQKHRRGLVLIIEDRIGKGYKEYGIENHAEFINFTNSDIDKLVIKNEQNPYLATLYT